MSNAERSAKYAIAVLKACGQYIQPIKEQAAERAANIAILGMAPEGSTPDDLYAATPGELAQWAAEKLRAVRV